MLNEHYDVTTAAYAVGYESLSHFSREYLRMVPPKGEVSVDIPHAATGDISFQTINDYGALTPRIEATMQ